MTSHSTLGLWATLLGLASLTATAQGSSQPADSGFSFDVFGDSRSMMYLPYKQSEEAQARQLMVDLFDLVLPAKTSQAMVDKNVKLTYDPTTHELVQVVMPFATASEVTTLTVDKGWVTEASVEDVKLLPGVRRVMFRLQGGDWVAREVARDVETGKAQFVLHTGDLVWWGKQGDKPSENPYWTLIKKQVLQQLPPPDKEMQAAGLEGRLFPAAGNHEVFYDPEVQGLLASFPYLKKLGVTSKHLIYKFDYRYARFIFLWTGKYDYRNPTGWSATRPAYEEQMKQLQAWLGEARAKGIKKVFIAFHAPVFARAGFGPIPEAQNPHKTIAAYAQDLDIVVFNGHIHTTEVFEVDGVKYVLAGGGGAEQDPILPGRTDFKVPEGYPPDQYWRGESPKEDYNWIHVEVRPEHATKFTLNRFRPWAHQPFESIELFHGK